MPKSVFRIFLFLATIVILSHLTQSQSRTDHVILVIIDGARYSETLGDVLALHTPRLHELASQGSVADSFLNDGITVTNRAIPAIWCGSWSTPKDSLVNGVWVNQYASVPTVWEYFRKARGVDSTQAMYIMKWLTTPWLQSFYPGYGPSYWPWYIVQESSDLTVWENARAKLQTYHPALTLLYLPDVDYYGSKDWTSYTRSIRIADSIVGMLWDFVQADPGFQNATSVLVTNDHGRHLDGISNGFLSHGDGCWGCRHIMFLGIGAGFSKGMHSSTRHTICDITPTIGALLKFPTPLATGTPMTEILTSVGQASSALQMPEFATLEQNYPNPFNPSTTIRYSLSVRSRVIIGVFNILGQRLEVIVNAEKEPGNYETKWNPDLPSGLYFCRIEAISVSDPVRQLINTKKMILLR